MPHRTIRARRLALAPAGVLSLALVATACGGSGGGTSAAPKDFTYLSVTENTTTRTALTTLSTSACKAENDALPLKVETIPQAQLDQKLQLLAGQDALPGMFAAGNAPALTKQLAKGGKVADIELELERLGVLDQLEPAAVSTIKALYGGKLMALPYEYNIEGIFYNKKLFQGNGIAVPGTWDELLAAADKLNAKGIQPFSASGAQGWPLTRLISGYLYRSLGPDALDKVDAGTARLTDPEYVKAAEEVAALGKKGYFGKGVGSIDYDTAMNQFLTGKSGMFYMGSWALANIADPKQNKIGTENVGFMPFPAVKGGKGSIDQYPSNIGLAVTLGSKTFDDKTGAWVGCIAENFGSTALKDHGTITGFKVNTPVKDSSEVAGTVRKTISGSKQNVLWFEALFSTKATTLSNTSAPGLVNGSVSPQKFMETVQAALGSQ
ncbi:extracellular solute-binding protein [Streptomyces sp. G2]|uniref:ABC transporter substrate-binding protein n=1 Tax=Streptomyces sp. G2 TaxID=1684471 RepID=UPI002030C6AF|nr:extracellular solute-binding protein [Streptomyces sp. G2]MCM1946099.1 extracellular solute-binding protein [Streptomyces sp. G2]